MNFVATYLAGDCKSDIVKAWNDRTNAERARGSDESN